MTSEPPPVAPAPGRWEAPDRPTPLTRAPGPVVAAELDAADVRRLRERFLAPAPFPFRMRPLRVIDTFDHAFAVLKSQTRVVALLLLPLIVPLELAQSYRGRSSANDTIFDFFGSPGSFGRALGDDPSHAVFYVANLAVLSVAGVLLARMLRQWHEGLRPQVRTVLAGAPRLALRAVGVFVVVHLVELVAVVAAVVGTLFVIPLVCVASAAVGIEDLGPWRALRRSIALTRSQYLRAVGFTFFAAFVVFAVGVLFGWLPSSIASALGRDRYGWVVAGVASVAYNTISTGFVALASGIFFYDLRMRREGTDLATEVAVVFGA